MPIAKAPNNPFSGGGSAPQMFPSLTELVRNWEQLAPLARASTKGQWALPPGAEGFYVPRAELDSWLKLQADNGTVLDLNTSSIKANLRDRLRGWLCSVLGIPTAQLSVRFMPDPESVTGELTMWVFRIQPLSEEPTAIDSPNLPEEAPNFYEQGAKGRISTADE